MICILIRDQVSKGAFDITGQKIGNWLVIEYQYEDEMGKDLWLVECSCGNRQTITGRQLRAKTPCVVCAKTKHDMTKSHEYKAWGNMIQRCTNSHRDNYQYYGGRGIKVCDRWLKFDAFFEDMGECPKGLTLDRVDNMGDYCKENCRWTTWKEQAKNRRKVEGWKSSQTQ
jgi:hypothetical protein